MSSMEDHNQLDYQCPVCLLTYKERGESPVDSMENHGYKDDCAHYFCMNCLTEMDEYGIHTCPLCRRDISPLMDTLYSTDEEDA